MRRASYRRNILFLAQKQIIILVFLALQSEKLTCPRSSVEEQQPSKLKVTGSIPVAGTIWIKKILSNERMFALKDYMRFIIVILWSATMIWTNRFSSWSFFMEKHIYIVNIFTSIWVSIYKIRLAYICASSFIKTIFTTISNCSYNNFGRIIRTRVYPRNNSFFIL